jgi:hypothetical protein
MSELEDLLSRLQAQTARPVRGVTYQGQAVGRDEDHLHLAVETGVIAIPLTAIEQIRHLEGGRSFDLVSVDVSDQSGIKQLRRVVPMPSDLPPEERASFLARLIGGSGPIFGGDGVFATGDTVTVNDITTHTITGGVADASDDSIPDNKIDDYFV